MAKPKMAKISTRGRGESNKRGWIIDLTEYFKGKKKIWKKYQYNVTKINGALGISFHPVPDLWSGPGIISLTQPGFRFQFPGTDYFPEAPDVEKKGEFPITVIESAIFITIPDSFIKD